MAAIFVWLRVLICLQNKLDCRRNMGGKKKAKEPETPAKDEVGISMQTVHHFSQRDFLTGCSWLLSFYIAPFKMTDSYVFRPIRLNTPIME